MNGLTQLLRVEVPAPWTLTCAFAGALGDVIGITSSGPPERIPVILTLLTIAFAADSKPKLNGKTLSAVVFVPVILLASWMLTLAAVAWVADRFSADTLVVLVVPLAIAAGALVSLFTTSKSPVSGTLAHSSLALTSLAYTLLGGINALLSPQGTPPPALSHERLFMMILVLCLPWRRYKVLIRVVALIASAVAVYRYPTATVLIATLVAGVVLAMIQVRDRNLRLAVFMGIVLMGGVAAIPLQSLIPDFYGAVGRVDNSDTRAFLWAQAVQIIQNHPWRGGAFTQSITGFANINGQIQPVPFHNSFLTLGVAGGGVLEALFALLLLQAFASQVLIDFSKKMPTIVLPALSAGVVTLSVNPTLDKFGTSVAFYSLIGAALLSRSGLDKKVGIDLHEQRAHS